MPYTNGILNDNKGLDMTFIQLTKAHDAMPISIRISLIQTVNTFVPNKLYGDDYEEKYGNCKATVSILKDSLTSRYPDNGHHVVGTSVINVSETHNEIMQILIRDE